MTVRLRAGRNFAPSFGGDTLGAPIALVSVSYQAVTAGLADPVRSLRFD